MIKGIEIIMRIFDITYLYKHFFVTYEYEFIMEDIENINIEIEYKNITNTIEVRSNAVEESLKRRTNDVKFAVGMIVTHTYKDSFSLDNHYGVIIGLHRGYDIKIEDKLKKTIMFPYLHKCQQFSAINCTTLFSPRMI
ncbi:uncharacterized protein LOC115235812 [Formica exsecta]|uniref:uncharacterized protein LOC115235812 n=1 Tax=Formica exsecta TaxID=72781 RepID=UPI001141F46F|nr:uncharacterized protein LOC115235812 [Formica exsecta]